MNFTREMHDVQYAAHLEGERQRREITAPAEQAALWDMADTLTDLRVRNCVDCNEGRRADPTGGRALHYGESEWGEIVWHGHGDPFDPEEWEPEQLECAAGPVVIVQIRRAFPKGQAWPFLWKEARDDK